MVATMSRKGFTLVELAVSLVVIGLLVGLGTAMVGPLMTAIKVRETKETIGGVVESLNSWASGNNSIPNDAGFANVVKSPQDSWGRNFVYLYDANLYSATATKDTICGRRTTSLTLTTTDPAATIANVAYMILSSGDDASIQTTLTGSIATNPAFVSGNTIPNDTRSSATGTITLDANNSDIVRWVTLDELRTKVGCQGAQLRIVNNELPYGYENTKYVNKLYIDGGVASYKWCVSSTPAISGLSFIPINSSTGAKGTAISACTIPTNCSSLASDTGWVDATPPVFLNISGMPTTRGSYKIRVMAHDSQGASLSQNNCADKEFALTINPQ